MDNFYSKNCREMFFPSSCFGYTLQTGVKLVAVVQLILAVILFALTIELITSAEKLVSFIVAGVFLLIQTVQIIVAFYLFEGSKQRDEKSCRFWISGTFILTFATVVYSVYEIYDNQWARIHATSYMVLSATSVISNIIFMWITYGFVQELREEDGEGGTVYNL